MEERITGVMIYYYFVCSRKLWYFCHQINMEDENENVQLGKLLDENSYKRDDKHIEIDGIINIDFIHEKNELHEIKKSKSIEEAGIWQVKYYLYYLKKRNVDGLHGVIDYPLLKKNVDVELSDEDKFIISIHPEGFHLDKPGRIVEHISHIHTFDRNTSPGDIFDQRLFFSTADNRKLYVGTDFSPHQRHDFIRIHIPASDDRIVDFHNPVTILQPGSF